MRRNVEVGKNLIISDRAHVIFPWHMAEDRAMDSDVSGGEAIGSTQRGIGPCYRDKVAAHTRFVWAIYIATISAIASSMSLRPRTNCCLFGTRR